jgi:hypothetical protein
MLVEPDTIVNARIAVGDKGALEALQALQEVEPSLGAFIQEALAAAAGKITLSGVPTPVVQGIHEEVLATVLTCVEAVRRSHYELWKDTAVGTRLAELAPDLPRRKRRKKRSPDTGPEEQPPRV